MTPAVDRLDVPRGTGSTSTRGAGVTDRVGLLEEHRGYIVLVGIALAILFVATQRAWFFHDEWWFINGRSLGDPTSWFQPHVQHFVAIHAAVYTALLAIFGTSSYLPFLATMFAAHVAFATGIYVLIDRHVGRGPALASAAILLLLGSGYGNLFWAFQMGPISSVALALWALLVVRTRPILAAILLGCGVATALFALMVVPALVVYGRSRQALAVAVVPVVVYGTWYVLVGRVGMQAYGDAPTLQGWLPWIPGGLAAAAAALTGLGIVGAVVIVVAIGLAARAPDLSAATVGLLVVVSEYAIIGLGRQGANTPEAPAYVYFGAAFLLPVCATAWRGTPRVVRPAFALLAGVALASNVLYLAIWSQAWPAYMRHFDTGCIPHATTCAVPF